MEIMARRKWEQNLGSTEFLSEGLHNNQGKSQIFGENELLIFAIINALKRAMNERNSRIHSIPTWSDIEMEVSTAFRVWLERITELRKGFIEDGDV